jgi:hypothetical protein
MRKDFGPSYLSTMRQYNASVRSYNANCANHRMLAVDIAAANEGLNCPAVPQP